MPPLRIIIALLTLTVLVLTLPVRVAAVPARGCVGCHGDTGIMTGLGYPQFFVTSEEVQRQSGMPASCPDCHRGNPATTDRVEAHRGMGRLLVVRKRGFAGEPADRKAPLAFGTNPAARIRYEIMTGGRTRPDPFVTTILYQDRRSDTLSQDFGMMATTCGHCHPKQLDEFRRSVMGRNARQSRYLAWDGEHGPHNCGVWYADAYANLSATTAVPFSPTTAALNQRACNTCHVGCLDCHYEPSPKNPTDPRAGMHRFRKTPEPLSCYGGGRGSICHAGPEDRRRGAGYFGGAFSFPEGLPGDVHRTKGVGCLDCHASSRTDGKIAHGAIFRQATCNRCHVEIASRHEKSLHARLACESCHIREAGGYQATFWGPGILAGSPTPYFKYMAYYGVMKDPILIRDRDGRWIPVKPFPMAVMNQRSSARTRVPGLYWRWDKDLPGLPRTGDAWGYAGIFGGLPENNRALLWLQMDKLSHGIGKSRSCDSCHADPDGSQKRQVRWEYGDEGAFPFNGSHTVVADRDGLAIRGMKVDEEIEAQPGFVLSSFAPWLFLPDRWTIPGNFALPQIKDRSRYERLKQDLPALRREGITH